MRAARILLRASALAGAVIALGAGPSLANEIRVSNNPSCPGQYPTIQAGVTAAAPGDTVEVCPGTYQEQVRIATHAKDGVKLVSLKPLQAKILFPLVTTPPNALVQVSGANDVTIRGFTISGPYYDSGCVVATHYGVRVDGGGSAGIYGNYITQIRDAIPALYGCQDGVAIQVGRQAEGQVGSADIEQNAIDKYQKNGPTIDNSGSYGTVQNNWINGGGPSDQIARNGIQVGRGAGADVHNNEVFGNSYSVDFAEGTGILVFQETGGVEVTNNESYRNDFGIDVGTASNLLISNNNTHDNAYDGLLAESDTQHNLFAENQSSSNGMFECEDDSHDSGTAGTANWWKNDFGAKALPSKICRRDGEQEHQQD